MKIGVDAMGGDYAPLNVVLGAIDAVKLLDPGSSLVLFGNQNKIQEICTQQNTDASVFSIVHTNQVIGMGEYPSNAFKSKTDSSMAVGFRYLKEGKIDAFAGIGSTGAMMLGSVLTVKITVGVNRPCLAIEIPSENGGRSLLLDIGFNTDCRPDFLYDFGLLGSIYAKSIMGIARPRVALLNIGEEEEKGNLYTKEAFKLMSDSRDYFFVGNIEGTKIYTGTVADVIVTDGFTGNIVLKQTEAMYQLAKAQGMASHFFDQFDYERYGGAAVLGLNATVIIGHGASSPKAVTSMIKKAEITYKQNLTQKIKDAVAAV